MTAIAGYYNPKKSKQEIIDYLSGLVSLFENDISSIDLDRFEVSVPLPSMDDFMGLGTNDNFELYISGRIAYSRRPVETPPEKPKEVVWETEKVDVPYLVAIKTSEMNADDIEVTGYDGEVGAKYEFHCPVCGDNLYIAEHGWWETKCQCGYGWDKDGHGTMSKLVYSDGTEEE